MYSEVLDGLKTFPTTFKKSHGIRKMDRMKLVDGKEEERKKVVLLLKKLLAVTFNLPLHMAVLQSLESGRFRLGLQLFKEMHKIELVFKQVREHDSQLIQELET